MGPGTDDRDLIVAVSRDVVTSIAPEESVLFRPVSAAYFEHPERLSRGPRDDMLGFGVGEVVVTLTPVVLTVVSETIVYLRGELAKTVARDAVAALDVKVKALFRRFHQGQGPAEPVPALSHDQLAEVRRLAFEKARVMRLSEERANLLADAVVGSLAVAT